MKRMGGAILAAVAGAALCGVGATAARAETWDMPMAYPDSNFHTQNGKDFAACVTTGTGGALEITVHSSGSLFKGNEIKRAVQTGQAQIGERLLSAHENENAAFGFDSIPFLATSYDDAHKLLAAARPTLERILEEQNLVLLYAVPWPGQGLYFKKPVNGVADMAGIKFRSYNSATARLAELAGMAPVQIEAAELSQALATGVAESFISSGATGYDSKVWEQLTHFYDVNAWLPNNSVIVNKDAWDGLDDATRNVLRACGAFAESAGFWRSRQFADFTLNELAAHGMTVQPASDALRADLAKIGETMIGEWLERTGADGQAILDAYKAAQ